MLHSYNSYVTYSGKTCLIAGYFKMKYRKTPIANCLSCKIEYIGHVCHSAAGAWLSNFCHSFRNPLDIINSNMESLQKQQNVLRIEGEK